MKGQKLLVRAISPGDEEELVRFAGREDVTLVREPDGVALLAKLVGEVVAVAVARPEGGRAELVQIVVARDLRRKRIGRALLEALIEELRLRGSVELLADPRPRQEPANFRSGTGRATTRPFGGRTTAFEKADSSVASFLRRAGFEARDGVFVRKIARAMPGA